MESQQSSIINVEILSIIMVSIGVWGYWYFEKAWFRIFFAELFGAGILTAVLPLALFLERRIIKKNDTIRNTIKRMPIIRSIATKKFRYNRKT